MLRLLYVIFNVFYLNLFYANCKMLMCTSLVDSAHTDSIITEDKEVAELFLRQVDRYTYMPLPSLVRN